MLPAPSDAQSLGYGVGAATAVGAAVTAAATNAEAATVKISLSCIIPSKHAGPELGHLLMVLKLLVNWLSDVVQFVYE